MKRLFPILLALFLVVGMVSSGNAILIKQSTMAQWSGSFPKNPAASDIKTITGTEAELAMLYKQDQGVVGDGGPWAGHYATVFSNTDTDPADATITWTGNPGDPYIIGNPLYLLVKDGNHDPIWYIFDLLHLDLNEDEIPDYAWNGTDTIKLQGFWPAQGTISHVGIYGPTTSVPEPATMLLLGAGLVSLAAFGRKRFRRE
jgi:hypothetical protein